MVPADINLIDEDSAFLVSNLYTKSKLGEDALINVSIEKTLDKKIMGTAIIRSKIKVKNSIYVLGIFGLLRRQSQIDI